MRQSPVRKPLPVFVDVLENRRMLSSTLPAGTAITIGGVSPVHDVSFTASNGRTEMVSVGSGQAILDFSNAPAVLLYHKHAIFDVGDVQTLDSITLINAIPGKAALSVIGTTPGHGYFDVESITGGNLATINARDVNITGSLNVGSVKNVILSAITGANVVLGSVASAVKVIGTVSGSLTADSLHSLSANQLLNEQITTTGTFRSAQLQIGSVTIAHAISGSTITSAGNIGTIKAAAIQDSIITAAAHPVPAPAGQTPGVQVPVSSSVFTARATIHTVHLPLGNVSGSFSNSIITAYALGSLQLGEIDGGGGIAAHNFSSVAGVGPTGELDRIFFHLPADTLRSTTKLRSTLTTLGVTFLDGIGSVNSTVIYGFNINLLG